MSIFKSSKHQNFKKLIIKRKNVEKSMILTNFWQNIIEKISTKASEVDR